MADHTHLAEVDGVRVFSAGKGDSGSVSFWNGDPYLVAMVVRRPGLGIFQRWEAVIYRDRKLSDAETEYAITRSGALSKIAFQFARAGVSVQPKLRTALEGFIVKAGR